MRSSVRDRQVLRAMQQQHAYLKPDLSGFQIIWQAFGGWRLLGGTVATLLCVAALYGALFL